MQQRLTSALALASVALLTALAVACGGGGDGDDAGAEPFDGVVVESSDGLASLAIPTGALPEGVSTSEITIESIVVDDAQSSEGVVTIAAYELLPDGLELSAPATLRIPVDDTPSGAYAVWHLTEETEELLETRLAASGDALELDIEHFSHVVAQDLGAALKGFIEADIELGGGARHAVGQPFAITGFTKRRTREQRIEFQTPGGGSIEARLRSEPRLELMKIEVKAPLSPNTQQATGSPPPDPFSAQFVCQATGGAGIVFTPLFRVRMDYVRLTPEGTLRERDGASGSVLLVARSFVNCLGSVPETTLTPFATSALPPAATEPPRIATEPPRVATPELPPAGYVNCQESPTQEANFCSPTVQVSGTRQLFGPERLELLTLTVIFSAAPPQAPEHFVGFNVIITPEAPGTTAIERLLRAFAGGAYECSQGQGGIDLPIGAGEVCGQINGNTMTMIFDLSAYQGSEVTIEIFTIETGAPDGLRRGDASRTKDVLVPCC